jgi:hypothetical protein
VTSKPTGQLLLLDDYFAAHALGFMPFDSGFLRAGETFRETFSIPGAYRYAERCMGVIAAVVNEITRDCTVQVNW